VAHDAVVSFERLVAYQAGAITLAQAVAAGMSAATVQRRVREGRWTRLHPRTYLVGGHRPTPEARIRAAWLWAGADAVVTGPSAAYWHHMLEQPPASIDVTVPARAKPRPQPGIRLARRDLYGSDVTECADARVTRVAAPPFAALETAVALPDGSTFLDRVLQRHIRFPALYRDGRAWHVDPDRFRNDRRKGNYITRCGWDLLRVTWHGLHEQPTESVAEIRQTLAAAA
jgi:hypothetical protein